MIINGDVTSRTGFSEESAVLTYLVMRLIHFNLPGACRILTTFDLPIVFTCRTFRLRKSLERGFPGNQVNRSRGRACLPPKTCQLFHSRILHLPDYSPLPRYVPTTMRSALAMHRE